MKLEDIPTNPATPEIVVTEAKAVQGLDILGLRSPAESIAVRLMDGITTITPLVRYFSVRAWMITRYLELHGLNDWTKFTHYAAKIEAAIAFGNVLATGGTRGVIGRNRASTTIEAERRNLKLRKLTQILAVSIYAASAEALGLGINDGEIPAVTTERGLPLAEAFRATIPTKSVLNAITVGAEEQTFSRDSLMELGDHLIMEQPQRLERDLLINAVIPQAPRSGEFPRVASYGLLLHLSQQHKRTIDETDIFLATAQENLDSIPVEFHEICDGWTRFGIRDLLVMVHEAAVALVLRQLEQASTPDKRLPIRMVLATLVTDEIDAAFKTLKLGRINIGTPICKLYKAVHEKFGSSRAVRGLNRWEGNLEEAMLIKKEDWLAEPAGLALLPVAWIIACHRLQPGLAAGMQSFDLEGLAGTSRLGVRAVLQPEVESWQASNESIRDVIVRLVHRSVDQHLRIAWSRMAQDPKKDVSLLQSDGDDWIHLKEMSPGRATSRLYQAVNWLEQLGLTDESGITPAGKVALANGLKALKKGGK